MLRRLFLLLFRGLLLLDCFSTEVLSHRGIPVRFLVQSGQSAVVSLQAHVTGAHPEAVLAAAVDGAQEGLPVDAAVLGSQVHHAGGDLVVVAGMRRELPDLSELACLQGLGEPFDLLGGVPLLLLEDG